MPFAATWMDLEIVQLSKPGRKDKCDDIAYTWNLKKYYIRELIYKTETESQMQKTNLQLPEGKSGEGRDESGGWD